MNVCWLGEGWQMEINASRDTSSVTQVLATALAQLLLLFSLKWCLGSKRNCSQRSCSCNYCQITFHGAHDSKINHRWMRLTDWSRYTTLDRWPEFIFSLSPSLSDSLCFYFSPLSPFDSSSPSLALHDILFSVFLPPTQSVSFYLIFLLFSFPPSLFISFCLSPWEFGKCSVSLMKGKCCFTFQTLFWFSIKGNLK